MEVHVSKGERTKNKNYTQILYSMECNHDYIRKVYIVDN